MNGNFTRVNSTTPPYRLIFRSYGPEKSGKTHFGLTGPGPIAIQSFDIGLEGVVEQFVNDGKEIYVAEYEFNRDNDSQVSKLKERFIHDYKVALKEARTIIWDTETELWELFRLEAFGLNKQGVATDAPKDYTKVNSEYRDLIQLAYDCGVNLQLIQKVKERWTTAKRQTADGRTVDSPVPSGLFEPTGFKEVGYIVQANLRHSWDKERGFVVDVINCRQNMGLGGETFEDISLPTLGKLVFPGSPVEAWQ